MDSVGKKTALVVTAFVVVSLLGLGVGSARIFLKQDQEEVQLEKTPRYLPAGRGQKPFDVTRHLIPLDQIQGGGPPKDGIPALAGPLFVSAAEADLLLKASDVVLGLEFDGVAKAYPIRILNWHELVNDYLGPQPVLVSW